MDFVPNWRHSDPHSSEVAGIAVEKNNTAARQRDTALQLVKLYPGKTSKELAQYGMDRYALARRLPELLRADLVIRTEQGECRWYPYQEQTMLL